MPLLWVKHLISKGSNTKQVKKIKIGACVEKCLLAAVGYKETIKKMLFR